MHEVNSNAVGAADTGVAYLKKQLHGHVSSFEKKRDENFAWVKSLRIGAIAIGALTTILLGLDMKWPTESSWPSIFKNVAFALSTIGTGLAAWEMFFNPRELWIRYTLTAGRLKALQAELEYRDAANELPGDRRDKIFEDLQVVLAETNSDWGRVRESKAGGGTTAGSGGGMSGSGPGGSANRQPLTVDGAMSRSDGTAADASGAERPANGQTGSGGGLVIEPRGNTSGSGVGNGSVSSQVGSGAGPVTGPSGNTNAANTHTNS